MSSRGARALGRAVPSVWLVAALLATACGGDAGGARMTVVTPPDGWEEALLEDRAARDREFQEAPDTPIHPDDRETFESLEYWPPDPSYYFVGDIHEHPTPDRFRIITTTGQERPCERYGWLSFELDGETHNLQIYRLLDSPAASPLDELFLPFADKTSGDETYPAGRYVKLAKTDDGRFVLDFNRANNPLCAYGMPEKFACPVTPTENRLPVRVEAGEQGYRRHP